MAGIGFQLAKMAGKGGFGGIVGAAAYGAMVSAGPWLVTVVATLALARWMPGRVAAADIGAVQTVLIYGFSLSALSAAPGSLLTVRLVSDRLYAGQEERVPGLVIAALLAGGVLAFALGAVMFGFLAGLSFRDALLATLLLTWLTQIWIVSPLLTAIHHYRLVTLSYVAGAGTAALLIGHALTSILIALAAGAVTTLILLLFALRHHFRAAPHLDAADRPEPKQALLLVLAGCAAAGAMWVDKIMLWQGPGSVATLGALRLNPVNDYGSFLGILTIIPGLTLILIATETRFDRAFGDLLARCTGTSTMERIEQARREILAVILRDFRLLLVVQSLFAALSWVFAVPLFDALGGDTAGIFAFRHTAAGVLFHLIAIQMTVILSYYDLFGRILLVWGSFVIASIAAVWLQWDLGVAAFGRGYMTGALAAAAVGFATVLHSTSQLTYLLFIGNNPAIIGARGRWF
ncbi:exopolysaccharide Pel transporter PelG [Sphingobium sufflavum]|uniref:exopolysaccharide Pel transporter PelG n=1 Tax=Sphingobium sufflavum TaxID=1129547 RepID=UPI001F3E2BA3|nr:exopolysaccharide Pel transporter PelG [Sphingobium sufflavum]MCE7796311.1 exopolysaccharide Pel transporter PelG [Sphingobium sufflavum]